ncbi:MAG TPA: response regulator [Candidatus Polarisedimenticolia bacterium]
MGSLPHPSIIIADNNEFYRQVLGDLYRELGYDVRVAADGLEALEMIQDRRPDLLMLDLIMPRFDGARVCAFLKGQEKFKNLPIIILSGILADEIEGVEDIRANAYIAKMPLEQIRETLQRISRQLLDGGTAVDPIVSGFEKMYRREVVLELLEDRKTSREILDSLSEGIAELSTEGRLTSCNRGFQTIAGLPSEELLSRPIDEVFSESRPALASLFDEIERGGGMATAAIRHGALELQIKLHRFHPGTAGGDVGARDAQGRGAGASGVRGAVRKAAETTAKVRLGSMIKSIGYTLLAEDITQRVRAEREREQLRARLAQSEKMSAIGLFVAGAAHELNNPLTSVLGYAQLLAGKYQDPDLQRCLEKISAGASRCKMIVENLMAFAKAHRLEKIPLDFGVLLREALAVYQDRLTQAGVRIELDLSPDLPRSMADPEQINQAFLRILDNACKALSSHEGERTLTVSASADRGRILIEFSDSGPGIPEEVMGRIYEPFFTTRQVGQGQGLGLSVAYGMVTAHAGRISTRNRPGGGATVSLEFPIVRKEAIVEAAPPPDLQAPLERPAEHRILIVDDEEVVRELLMDILEGERHRIDTAGNGLEGLRKIETGEYDLVILDLKMPDMSGQQMYDEMSRRRPELLPRTMFITADTVTPEVERFLRRVRRPCVIKPFAIDNVLSAVRGILSRA